MNRLQANICIFTVLFCWAFEGVLLKNMPAQVPSIAITTWANCIGFVLMFVIFFKRLKQNFSQNLFYLVLVLAFLNLIYNLFFIEGIRHLTTEVSFFASTEDLVAMPLVLLFFREKSPWQVWAGIAVVMFGIALSLDWSFPLEQTKGLLIMGAYAILRDLYIIRLADLSRKFDVFAIAALMQGQEGFLSLLLWLGTEPESIFTMEYSPIFWASIFALVYFTYIFALVISTFAQKYVSALVTASIYALYPAVCFILVLSLPVILTIEIELTVLSVCSCILVTLGALCCGIDWRKTQPIPEEGS